MDLYGSIDDNDDKPYISSAFSDFSLKAESKDNLHYKAFADLRFRYGTEFLEPVKRIDLREAYVRVNGKKWDVTAGQTIIKWGRDGFHKSDFKAESPELHNHGHLILKIWIWATCLRMPDGILFLQ